MISGHDIARSLVAGFVGTVAMTTTTRLQGLLGRRNRPIDYDDSLVVVKLAQRWTPLDLDERSEIVVNQLMRFGYGSSVGLLRHLLEGRVHRPAAALFAIMWGGEAMSLRLVRVAPAPWRWQRDVLATSIAHHVVYAVVTDIAYRSLDHAGDEQLPVLVDPDRALDE